MNYDIYNLGFDKFITKSGSVLPMPEYAESAYDEINPGTIGSGEADSNTTLVNGYYQSSNFVTGDSGWRFDADGNLEANNGYFRGEITANTGSIGGFTIGSDYIKDTDGKLVLDSSDQTISVGSTNTITIDGDDGSIYSSDYVVNTSGWKIWGDGTFEANDGNFRGDITGATGTFSGTVNVGSLNIPDTTTANSFHVNTSGDAWWGATTIGSSNAKVLKTGVATFKNITANDSTLSFQTIFGNGADGNVTISANTTLTKDMYYGNLTVNNGVTLNTGAFRVFVKETLTNNGTITITTGDGTVGGDRNGSGGTGSAGIATSGGSVYGGTSGVVGAGGLTEGNDGTDITKGIGSDGSEGGYGYYYAGQIAGGSGGTISGTVYNKINSQVGAYTLFDFLPTLTQIKSSGGSGSGGGSRDTNNEGNQGGGSGASCGIVWIAAKILVNNAGASINANGGNGGAGGSEPTNPYFNNTCGGAGGGAGGAGGVVLISYSSLTNSGTIEAAGGNGGAGGLGYKNQTAVPEYDGEDGEDGNDGVVYYLQQ